MSGPNTDYDPVEVTPLKAHEVDAMREAALAAIAGAGSLEELKQARIEHTAERAPLAHPPGGPPPPSPPARSEPCRHRPARTPGYASVRLAERSPRRSPPGRWSSK